MSSLNYGGQAVMEGVMMRGAREWAVAVRAPNGEIVTHHDHLPKAVYESRILKLPFLRGLLMLWDSLGLGMRALNWSADVALSEEEDVSFSGPLAWGTVALSVALGVGLFILLPTFIIGLLDRYITTALLSNLVEGVVRLGIFVLYIWAIGLMPDIRRVFAYHGAEHKTINAYEAGAELTPEAVSHYSRVHTRCGTGFMLIVLVIFVVVSTLLGRPAFWLRLTSRILMIPIVSGIAYEIIKLSARYYDRSRLVRILMAPSLALQQLTTREPSLDMLEVSIQSLQMVLRSEGLLAAEAPAASEATLTEPIAYEEATHAV
ncbi:MAG: DUF1385 domain-containing protein [Anaerolineales bacterium]